MKSKLSAVVVGTVLILSVAGCGSSTKDDEAGKAPSKSLTKSASPEAFSVSGTLTLIDGVDYYDDYLGADCTGSEGYGDITEGAQIVIKDAAGKQIAIGALGHGKAAGPKYDRTCEFSLFVPGVPVSGNIYSIEVSHRGGISFTQADAESGLRLTLGG